jgi:hypothetical protein
MSQRRGYDWGEGVTKMTISSEDVQHGYSFVLGRNPESEAIIKKHADHENIALFRESLLNSAEFRASHRRRLALTEEHPYVLWHREAVAFLHLPKTAGLSFHACLKSCFSEEQICPERQDFLHCYAPAELARYDLFSGHFGIFSMRFIPRQRVRTISIFRNPRARLISWYRFLRSQPLVNDPFEDALLPLAKSLEAEEFFENRDVISSPAANNMYLFFFGLPWPHPKAIDVISDERLATDILGIAKQQVRALDAVGLTEKFNESVTEIFRILGLVASLPVGPLNVTDERPALDASVSLVPPVEVTARLSRALDPLTRFDHEIYNMAVQEFELRRASAMLAAAN